MHRPRDGPTHSWETHSKLNVSVQPFVENLSFWLTLFAVFTYKKICHSQWYRLNVMFIFSVTLPWLNPARTMRKALVLTLYLTSCYLKVCLRFAWSRTCLNNTVWFCQTNKLNHVRVRTVQYICSPFSPWAEQGEISMRNMCTVTGWLLLSSLLVCCWILHSCSETKYSVSALRLLKIHLCKKQQLIIEPADKLFCPLSVRIISFTYKNGRESVSGTVE